MAESGVGALARIDALADLTVALHRSATGGVERFQIALSALMTEVREFESHPLHELTDEDVRHLLYLQASLGCWLARRVARGCPADQVVSEWLEAFKGDV
jgi:hypothetical protein